MSPVGAEVARGTSERTNDGVKVFVYEYLTACERLANQQSPDELQSLVAEGRAMCAALSEDFAKIDGVQVTQAAAEHDDAFDRAAAEADWSVIIAPEIGRALAERCRRVVAAGGRLLGCGPRLVELTSDKHATAEHLLQCGVPAPHGVPFLLGQPWPADFSYPAIWKPRDGAGSQGLRFVEHHDAIVPESNGRPGRLEEFCPRSHCGTPASVAVLGGPKTDVYLPPCAQRLGLDFRYLGGSLPLPSRLAQRASCLARRAIETLPEPLGYLGVDLVLGTEEDGAGDVVIEINPRLTTSYLGLRAACQGNLAMAMLAVASGESCRLTFRDQPIVFSADGEINHR